MSSTSWRPEFVGNHSATHGPPFGSFGEAWNVVLNVIDITVTPRETMYQAPKQPSVHIIKSVPEAALRSLAETHARDMSALRLSGDLGCPPLGSPARSSTRDP